MKILGRSIGLAALVVVTGGCAKPATRAVTPAPPPPVAPAPSHVAAPPPPARAVAKVSASLFGDLFESGRVFRYQVEQMASFYDPDDARANASGYVETNETSQILCAVSDVHEVALADTSRGKAAKLDCGDGNHIGMSAATVAGLYVLGPKGIYRYALDTKDSDLRAIPEDQVLLLELDPVASKSVDQTEDHSSAVEVLKEADGAWCKSREESFGDYFAERDCFVPGKGIVRAGRESSGGSTFVTTFTAI
ncbi:MAG: hypothetical protein U0414_27820 [Polyangiaceae bacterium]